MARSKREDEKPIAPLTKPEEPEVFEAEIQLSARHQAFVDAYLGPARFDGKAAARIAGYKPTDNNLTVVAHCLLKRPDVQAVIKERTRRNAMEADEALSHLVDIARGSMESFLDVEAAKRGEIKIDIAKAAEQGQLHLIKKIKMDDEGKVQVELYNRLEALVVIIKQLGLLRDKVDVGITLDMVLERLPEPIRDSVGRQLAQRVLGGADPGVRNRPALPPRGEPR